MHFVLFYIAFFEIGLVHKMCSKQQIKSEFSVFNYDVYAYMYIKMQKS